MSLYVHASHLRSPNFPNYFGNHPSQFSFVGGARPEKRSVRDTYLHQAANFWDKKTRRIASGVGNDGQAQQTNTERQSGHSVHTPARTRRGVCSCIVGKSASQPTQQQARPSLYRPQTQPLSQQILTQHPIHTQPFSHHIAPTAQSPVYGSTCGSVPSPISVPFAASQEAQFASAGFSVLKNSTLG